MITDNLKIFNQFGFKKASDSGDHAVGNCIFCGSSGHFYINVASQNKTWDCKSCGKGGGFQKFLEIVVKEATNKIDALAQDRGLSKETLLEAGVREFNGFFIIPVYNQAKNKLLNVKKYDGRNFMNATGCPATMYNVWRIPKDYGIVFICEGEWDTLVLQEIEPDNAAIIGVPGAATIKQELIPICDGKEVYLLFDNDEAGRKGIEKAINLLKSVTSEIYKIEWPKNTVDGFDIRDVYNQNKRNREKTFQYIIDNCAPLTEDEKKIGADTVIENGVPVHVQEVYDTFGKWLHMEDTYLLDFIFGTIIANRLPGAPVWSFIVGEPGGGKTAPLMSLIGAARIVFTGGITRAALISGQNFGNADPSLIPQLDGKTLVIKDYTPVLSMPENERNEINGILWDAYDGECYFNFSGIKRVYKVQFGILAAVTPAIDYLTDLRSMLGERFIRWNTTLPVELERRNKYVKKALANRSHKKEMGLELSAIAKKVLLVKYEDAIKITDKDEDWFINIGTWISYLRAGVNRDKYTRDIQHNPFVELATRITAELVQLACGISLFTNKTIITDRTKTIIKHVARSTASSRYLFIVKAIYSNRNNDLDTKELMGSCKLAQSTVDVLCGNLLAIGVVTRTLKDNKARWKLTNEFYKLTQTIKIFEE